MAHKTLPPEVLLITKNHVPISDLRTHVCLYLSSPIFAALYDSDYNADGFWERACWVCGIGRLPQEDSVMVDWRQIAIECIQKDGFCTHPQCGEALLQYNRECMEEVEEDIDELFAPVRITEDYEGGGIIVHRAFRAIRFRPGAEPLSSVRYQLDCDAYLRKNREGIDSEENRTYLREHPLIARSFATFVPTSSVFMVDLFGFNRFPYTLETWRPITVYDVLDIMHKSLDTQLSISDASDYVTSHEQCFEQRGWTVGDVFCRIHTLRDVFTVCPITRMEWSENTESGPSLSFDQK